MADDTGVQTEIDIVVKTDDASRQFKKFGDDARSAVKTASGAVDDLTASFKNAGDSAASFFKSFATAGAIAEFSRRSYSNFAEVQRGLERLQFSTGATTAQMASLKAMLQDVSSTTGQSMQQLEKQFQSFADGSSDSLQNLQSQFRTIADLSEVTGVSIGDLARAASAASNNLHLSSNQVEEMLRKWAIEIPSSMMGQFSDVVPRLTQLMESLGMSGEKAGEQIAAVFVAMARATGNTRLAFSQLNELLTQAGDASTRLGQIMLPQMQAITEAGGGPLDVLKAISDQLHQMGAFDPKMRPFLQEAFGVNYGMLKGLDSIVDHLDEINKRIAAGETQAEAISNTIAEFDQDPLAAVQRLAAAFDALGISFGNFLDHLGATAALNDFVEVLKNTEGEINQIKSAIDWLEAHSPKALLGGGGASVEQMRTAERVRRRDWHEWASDAPGEEQIHGPRMGYVPQSAPWWRKMLGFQEGGIVTHPTVAKLAETGPEAIVPLSGDGVSTFQHGGGRGGVGDNTKATQDNTAATNRLTFAMMAGRSRAAGGIINAAFTPGAGDMPWSSVAGPDASFFGGMGGGGLHSGGGYTMEGGAQIPGHYGGGGRSYGGDDDAAGGGGAHAMPGPGYNPPSHGMTSYGGAAGVQGLPGSPSGPAATPSAADLDPATMSGGQAYVAARRHAAGFDKQLQDPDTRALVRGIISAENPGAGPAVLESLMNRTEMVNRDRARRGLPPLTLKDMIRGTPSIGGGKSFYGPMRTGAINSHLNRIAHDPKYRARLDHYIDQAVGGSFTVKGFTDQGSAGDPNYIKGGTGVNINRERFNNWGYRGSAAFGEEYRQGYEKAEHGPHPHVDIGTPQVTHPDHQSMLESHRALRAELERPIRMSVAAPSIPASSATRNRVAQQSRRWDEEQRVATSRHKSMADIGIA